MTNTITIWTMQCEGKIVPHALRLEVQGRNAHTQDHDDALAASAKKPIPKPACFRHRAAVDPCMTGCKAHQQKRPHLRAFLHSQDAINDRS
ncbi:hypothetical protein [Xanthomonas bromi]|uniref:hypothetical protein n=1 Tax=Xanthomonas bromi TaxID=56449 RepID=UPI001112924E|nr:hypothetical protein [Xanthomonas bromi]